MQHVTQVVNVLLFSTLPTNTAKKKVIYRWLNHYRAWNEFAHKVKTEIPCPAKSPYKEKRIL